MLNAAAKPQIALGYGGLYGLKLGTVAEHRTYRMATEHVCQGRRCDDLKTPLTFPVNIDDVNGGARPLLFRFVLEYFFPIRQNYNCPLFCCFPVENSMHVHKGTSTQTSSSSRSSDGNSSLLDEGGSASQVPQASVQLASYGSVVSWMEKALKQTSTQTYKHANKQAHKHTSTQTNEHTNKQANMQLRKQVRGARYGVAVAAKSEVNRAWQVLMMVSWH